MRIASSQADRISSSSFRTASKIEVLGGICPQAHHGESRWKLELGCQLYSWQLERGPQMGTLVAFLEVECYLFLKRGMTLLMLGQVELVRVGRDGSRLDSCSGVSSLLMADLRIRSGMSSSSSSSSSDGGGCKVSSTKDDGRFPRLAADPV